MAPLVIDLKSTEDSRDVVHRAVQALVEGQLVAFPTETGYVASASGLVGTAVERLAALQSGGPALSLAIKGVDEALDYVPGISPVGQRLARRCWPGPVTLRLADNHPDSLLRQLPSIVQECLATGGQINLRVPAHPTLCDVLQMLAGPVVVAPATRQPGAEAMTAQEVVQSLGDDVQLVLDDGRSRYSQSASVVEVGPQGLSVVQEGVVSQQHLKRLSSLMILFVCTGNTCRSPMAEGLCKALLAERLGCRPDQLESRGVLVMSAGVAAMLGGRPSPEAVQVMSSSGVSLGEHESQPLTAQLVRHADYILAMTRSHRQAILAEWPEAADRTHLLSVDKSDIPDPIGGPTEVYQRCARRIEAELVRWLDRWQV